MRKATIIREKSTDTGTFGELTTPYNNKYTTLELPYYENKRGISSIPAGEYIAEPYKSKKFGDVWRLKDVPDRSDILIHAGNYAGDKAKGFKSDSEGCILLGSAKGRLDGHPALFSSKSALKRFNQEMGREESFILEIEDKTKYS